jgi:hypothetical protein
MAGGGVVFFGRNSQGVAESPKLLNAWRLLFFSLIRFIVNGPVLAG